MRGFFKNININSIYNTSGVDKNRFTHCIILVWASFKLTVSGGFVILNQIAEGWGFSLSWKDGN